MRQKATESVPEEALGTFAPVTHSEALNSSVKCAPTVEKQVVYKTGLHLRVH